MPTRAARATDPTPRGKSAPQRALEKLGLLRDIDLALHLPLRYEDETRIVPICELHDGSLAQVEGVVRDNQVQVRARRQLIVRIHDGTDDLVLRFLGERVPATGASIGVDRLLAALIKLGRTGTRKATAKS